MKYPLGSVLFLLLSLNTIRFSEAQITVRIIECFSPSDGAKELEVRHYPNRIEAIASVFSFPNTGRALIEGPAQLSRDREGNYLYRFNLSDYRGVTPTPFSVGDQTTGLTVGFTQTFNYELFIQSRNTFESHARLQHGVREHTLLDPAGVFGLYYRQESALNLRCEIR